MKTPTPWLRKSTGTWHVWFDGKQRYLGKDEKTAHEKFRKMTNTGVTENFTVRQVIGAYWKWAKQNLAKSTLENRKPILESFKASVKANLKAEMLRGHHVESCIDSCERVKSSTTRSDYISHIKGVMKWAKARGYVERNPIEDMPKPPRVVRQEFLPADTWPKVLALATEDQFRDFLTVMLSTGARLHMERGEKW